MMLREAAPAHPVAALAAKCSKIAPTWHQDGNKKIPNRAQGLRGAQREPDWRQDEVKTAKKF